MEDQSKDYCLECGIEKTGRLGKKYCSEKCKSIFNNRIAKAKRDKLKEKTTLTDQVHHILWRNRLILQHFENEDQVILKELERYGFRTNFITQFTLQDDRQSHFHVYDYSYYFIDENTLKILRP